MKIKFIYSIIVGFLIGFYSNYCYFKIASNVFVKNYKNSIESKKEFNKLSLENDSLKLEMIQLRDSVKRIK